MDVKTIEFTDLQSICRCCLCSCKDSVCFNVHSTLICMNDVSIVSEVLSKYASVQV